MNDNGGDGAGITGGGEGGGTDNVNTITPPQEDVPAATPASDATQTETASLVPLLVVPTRKKSMAKKKPRVRPKMSKQKKGVGGLKRKNVSKVNDLIGAGSKKLKSPSGNGPTGSTGITSSVNASGNVSGGGAASADGSSEKSGMNSNNANQEAVTTSEPRTVSLTTRNEPTSSSKRTASILKSSSKYNHKATSIRRPLRPSSSKSISIGTTVNRSKGSTIRPPSRTSSASSSATPQTSQEKFMQGTPTTIAPAGMSNSNQSDMPDLNENTNAGTNRTSRNMNEIITIHNNRTNNYTSTATSTDEVIIPYQHLGQLDPAWNVPPPKENEKRMKDFCSKYKTSKEKKNKNQPADGNLNNNNDQNVAAGGVNNSNGNANNNNQNTSATANYNPDISSTSNSESQGQEQAEESNRSGPLVEIINGEIVIKESSIIVGRRRTTEEVDKELNNAVIEEDSTGITATYRSFTTREKNVRWTVNETRKFFGALRQCGTDFTTMMNFFDGSDGMSTRSRKQLKSKYKIECRKNWDLIEMAMNPKVQLPLDISVFGELDMTSVSATSSSADTNTATHVNGNDNNESMSESTPSSLNDTVTATAVSKIHTPSVNVTPMTAIPENDLAVTAEGGNDQQQAINASLQAPIDIPLQNHAAISESSPKKVTQEVEDQPQQAQKVKEKEEESLVETVNIPLTIAGGAKKRKKPKFKARAKPKVKNKPKRLVR